MAEGRRIYYDDEDDERYLKLRANNIFEDLDLIDLFLIMVSYGKKMGMMAPLGDSATGRIRSSTIDSSNARYLMMALAADEKNSFEVLTDDNGINESRSAEDKYFSISEEYAKQVWISFLWIILILMIFLKIWKWNFWSFMISLLM